MGLVRTYPYPPIRLTQQPASSEPAGVPGIHLHKRVHWWNYYTDHSPARRQPRLSAAVDFSLLHFSATMMSKVKIDEYEFALTSAALSHWRHDCHRRAVGAC